jgi:hypothetical protein
VKVAIFLMACAKFAKLAEHGTFMPMVPQYVFAACVLSLASIFSIFIEVLFVLCISPLNGNIKEWRFGGVSIHDRVQTVILGAFVILLPTLQIALLTLTFMFPWKAAWFYFAYGIWILCDWKKEREGGRPIKWVQCNPMFDCLAEYFPVRLQLEQAEAFRKGQTYLFIHHPHGILAPFSLYFNFVVGRATIREKLPWLSLRTATLNVNFMVPLWREWMMAMSFISADGPSIRHHLQDNGHGVVLCVGGAEEAILARPNHNDVILQKRKGFIKMALQSGAHLVPVYGFGENNLYDNVRYKYFGGSDRIMKLSQKFKAFTRMSLPILNGCGVWNSCCGHLPRRVPLTTVVGPPIAVERVDEPSQEQIEDLHAIYTTALLDLYNRHKDELDAERESELKVVS